MSEGTERADLLDIDSKRYKEAIFKRASLSIEYFIQINLSSQCFSTFSFDLENWVKLNKKACGAKQTGRTELILASIKSFKYVVKNEL